MTPSPKKFAVSQIGNQKPVVTPYSSPKKGKRVVKTKGWAIVGGTICEARDETYDAWYHMTFGERKDAVKTLKVETINYKFSPGWQIVPCTISYELPKKKKP